MRLNTLYLALYGLTMIAIPSLSMNDEEENDQSTTWLLKKYTITETNLNKAISAIKERPTGDYLAKRLFIKLQKLINKELLVDQWSEEVTNAYNEILKDISPISAMAITMAHPLQEILYAMTRIIPN